MLLKCVTIAANSVLTVLLMTVGVSTAVPAASVLLLYVSNTTDVKTAPIFVRSAVKYATTVHLKTSVEDAVYA